MKHLLAAAAALACCVLLTRADEAKAPPRAGKSALTGDGPFRDVRKHLEGIFQFTLKDGRLQLDRRRWGQAPKEEVVGRFAGARFGPGAHPLEGPFRQIQSAGRNSSSGMSISGGEREIRFSGATLAGRLHTRGETVRMSLEETKAPHRALEFADEGPAGFRLQLAHADGDLVLLRQARDGSFTAVALVGDRQLAARGESFVDLYRKHRKDLDALVLPPLEDLGIRLMLSPQDPKVRRAVLSAVTRTPEKLAEGKKLIADLDSRKFATRDRATQLLGDRYELYKDLVQEALKGKALSLEARTRLQNLAARHEDSERVGQTVAALDLLRDGRYLAGLLDEATPEEAPFLVRQLRAATGQDLGSDPAAWRAWAAKKTP